MKTNALLRIGALAALIAIVCAASAQWKAVLLHPVNAVHSQANGLSATTQVGQTTYPDLFEHAHRWSGTSASALDINPSSFKSSQAHGISGNSIVGYGKPLVSDNEHALLWINNVSTDIHPPTFTKSFATGISGTITVGYGIGPTTANKTHALYWNGTSATDINPSNYTESLARKVDGPMSVGYGYGTSTGGFNHAIRWSNTISADMHPFGFISSYAMSISGLYDGGYAYPNASPGNAHAMVWIDTLPVDLHPSGFRESQVWDVSAFYQVGYGAHIPDDNPHALFWTGSPGSVVDLHRYLPPFYTASWATGVNRNAGLVVGTAYNAVTGKFHAVMWRKARSLRP